MRRNIDAFDIYETQRQSMVSGRCSVSTHRDKRVIFGMGLLTGEKADIDKESNSSRNGRPGAGVPLYVASPHPERFEVVLSPAPPTEY